MEFAKRLKGTAGISIPVDSKISKIFKKIEKVKLGGDLRAFGGSVPFY